MGPHAYKRLLWTIKQAALGILFVYSAFGAPPPTAVREDEVRTAFLFQLAQYVHWPAEAFSTEVTPLRFCLLGEDKLIPALKLTVGNKTIQGRPIAVLRVSDAGEMTKCHVVFVAIRSE